MGSSARKQPFDEPNSPYRSLAVKFPLVVVDCSCAAIEVMGVLAVAGLSRPNAAVAICDNTVLKATVEPQFFCQFYRSDFASPCTGRKQAQYVQAHTDVPQ